MRTWTVALLIVFGVESLLVAGILVLSLLGRLPGRKNARALRLIFAAVLVMTASGVLGQVNSLAHWSRLVRLVVDAVDMVIMIPAVALIIRAAILLTRGAGPPLGSRDSQPSGQVGPPAGLSIG